jgi:hypothetical protein
MKDFIRGYFTIKLIIVFYVVTLLQKPNDIFNWFINSHSGSYIRCRQQIYDNSVNLIKAYYICNK